SRGELARRAHTARGEGARRTAGRARPRDTSSRRCARRGRPGAGLDQRTPVARVNRASARGNTTRPDARKRWVNGRYARDIKVEGRTLLRGQKLSSLLDELGGYEGGLRSR